MPTKENLAAQSTSNRQGRGEVINGKQADNILEPEIDPLPEGAGQTEVVDYNISADIRDWANVMRGEDEEIPLL